MAQSKWVCLEDEDSSLDESILTEEKALAIVIASYGDKGYNLLKKAEAFSHLLKLYGSVNEVNKKTRTDKMLIRRYVRITQLPDEVKNTLLSREITSYYLAAELTRIDDKERLIATASNIAGVPREMGLEIIRFVLKNKDKKVEECVKIIRELYYDDIDIQVLYFNKNEIFDYNIMIDKELINKIKSTLFEKYSIEGEITLKTNEDEVIIVMDKKQIDIINNLTNTKDELSNTIKELIKNSVKQTQ